jgi:hypothetical protein
MKEQALHEAEKQSILLLERNLATHLYFTRELKPNIFRWTESFITPDYFDPSWMSSTYAIRQIDKIFHQLAKEPYYYKESAINARSPEAEADDYEKRFLLQLRNDPRLTKETAIRYFDGQCYLTVLRKGETFESSCMMCHSSPDVAPKGMLDIYGPDRGFGRQTGEVAQVISIRIPLSDAYGQADKFSLHLSISLLAVLLCSFGVLFVFTRRKVLVPIEQIGNKAILMANNPEHLGETIEEPPSRDLADLARAFNTMSLNLRNNMDELENRVAKRTCELEAKNIQLAQEIAERNKAEQEKSELIIELKNALKRVKKLSGLIPICSSCKKIRDDKGYWNEVERYIGEHSEALFSHSICPDCMRKLYPEIADEILGRLEKDEKK